jgi:hypothetical protein
MGKYWGKDAAPPVLPATNLGPKPGDFPLLSLESRAAARAMAEDKDEGIDLDLFLAGMPTLFAKLE